MLYRKVTIFPYIRQTVLIVKYTELGADSESSKSRFPQIFKLTDMSAIYGQDTLINKNMPEIIPFLIKWRRNAVKLRFLQILLGFLATFFSLLTATVLTVGDAGNNNIYAKTFAFIAAVSIGLITAFDLGTKSNNMTDAWRHLTATTIQYNKGLTTMQDVITAYEKGEKTIGNVTFNQQQQQQGVGTEQSDLRLGIDNLDKMAKLKDQGVISDEEFLEAKGKILGKT